jgi:hypothetical protein
LCSLAPEQKSAPVRRAEADSTSALLAHRLRERGALCERRTGSSIQIHFCARRMLRKTLIENFFESF